MINLEKYLDNNYLIENTFSTTLKHKIEQFKRNFHTYTITYLYDKMIVVDLNNGDTFFFALNGPIAQKTLKYLNDYPIRDWNRILKDLVVGKADYDFYKDTKYKDL